MTPTTMPRTERQLVFTSSQAARYLGVSLATIRRWTDAGHIACYRTPGGQRRFSREQLDSFVEPRCSRGGPRRARPRPSAAERAASPEQRGRGRQLARRPNFSRRRR